MRRRPPGSWWRLQGEAAPDPEESGIEEIADPDPTANFPQWSRSLLLLLDYAIIEGLQHDLHTFVHYLKLAEAELTDVASEATEMEEDDPSSSRTH